MSEPLNRRIARRIFRLSSLLWHIRTPQRTYRWTGEDRDMKFVGLRWLPCVTAVRLLELSESMDAEHWDHWALDGREHDGHLCLRCGGWNFDAAVTPEVSVAVNLP